MYKSWSPWYLQVYSHIGNFSGPNYVAIAVVYKVQNRTDFQCSLLLLHPELLWEKCTAVSALPLSICLGTGAQGSGQRRSQQEKGSVTAGERHLRGKQCILWWEYQLNTCPSDSQVQFKWTSLPSGCPYSLLPYSLSETIIEQRDQERVTGNSESMEPAL